MKVVNWIVEHIYWILAMLFLVISGVSFFAYNDVFMALFAYIGFFGCLNLHGISKVEQQIEKSMMFELNVDDLAKSISAINSNKPKKH